MHIIVKTDTTPNQIFKSGVSKSNTRGSFFPIKPGDTFFLSKMNTWKPTWVWFKNGSAYTCSCNTLMSQLNSNHKTIDYYRIESESESGLGLITSLPECCYHTWVMLPSYCNLYNCLMCNVCCSATSLRVDISIRVIVLNWSGRLVTLQAQREYHHLPELRPCPKHHQPMRYW